MVPVLLHHRQSRAVSPSPGIGAGFRSFLGCIGSGGFYIFALGQEVGQESGNESIAGATYRLP